jgi:hypothetical protein
MSVDDDGHCVGGESDAEEWESEAGDDGCLSVILLVTVRTWAIEKGGGGRGGWGAVPFSRESGFKDHGHGEED